MRKMFQYRLYPTGRQLHKLNETLEECRWLYNHLLETRKNAYEQTGKGLTLYQQQATFPILKTERSTLDSVHSQVLQQVAVRIDLAFKAFLLVYRQVVCLLFGRVRTPTTARTSRTGWNRCWTQDVCYPVHW